MFRKKSPQPLTSDDLLDIQGLVRFGYRKHPWAAYVLLRFSDDAAAVRGWLRSLVPAQPVASHHQDDVPIDTAANDSPEIGVNIAFTASGLRALDLEAETLDTFSPAFQEGMHGSTHRQRVLGDVDDSRPELWRWGSSSESDVQFGPVDALLLVFARSKAVREAQTAQWIAAAKDHGAIVKTHVLHGKTPGDDPTFRTLAKEPFGFVDGLSDPTLRGLPAKTNATNGHRAHEALADGEILLGRLDNNEYVSASPSVPEAADPLDLLKHPASDDRRRRDLGRNGTYLVFRQLVQDVEGFSDSCEAQARKLGMDVGMLKALLVGRHPNGAPLTEPGIDARRKFDHHTAAETNAFGYREHDAEGRRCPIGSHIRRVNPRDSLGEDAEEGWLIANRHRIARRGREWSDNGEQGLHFICLNADITRQFEFVQQTWMNNASFGGLSAQDDPISGSRHCDALISRASLPPLADQHIWLRTSELKRFVWVRGGAYFFLPSVSALRYLACDERVTRPATRTAERQAARAMVGAR